MRINITARRFKLSDQLKVEAENEVLRLKKYFDGIIHAEVILSWEKMDRLAEVNLFVYGTVLTAHERSSDMHKSIVGAVDKMERQLKKYKERIRGFEHESMANSQLSDLNHHLKGEIPN
ncbi:ribosome-associated translation inhibitor RaiA [bacterium]|nr:ribosome-associated translation inhibitor RaiA [bacterium]